MYKQRYRRRLEEVWAYVLKDDIVDIDSGLCSAKKGDYAIVDDDGTILKIISAEEFLKIYERAY